LRSAAKGGGVCPSCGGWRMSELAAQFVDRVLPAVPIRQWVFYEEFRAAPLAVVQGAYGFIGVRPEHVPAGLGSPHNRSALPRSPLLRRLLDLHVGLLVARHTPASLYHPLRRLRERMTRFNLRARAYPPLEPDLWRELRARFIADVAYVESCLGRTMPAWHEQS
jgi:hypothetical protein